MTRIDGIPKLTGRERYTRDIFLPFMLWAKVKRSPHPRARITEVNVSEAASIPGVKAIITGHDFPSIGTEETPALAIDEVNYVGQPVVAIAAINQKIAAEAIAAIDVEYEILPYISDPLEALFNPSVEIVHPNVSHKQPNVGKHIHVETGDFDSAFTKADLLIEDEYSTSAETHFTMEPLSYVVEPKGDGINVWAISSGPHKTQAELSRYLGMPMRRIRVTVPPMGGWLGSKEESHIAAICAMLAIRSGKPVKLELSREETIIDSATRHASIIKVSDAVSNNGIIIGRKILAVYDGGAYGIIGNVQLKNAILAAANVYNIKNFRLDAYRVFTNKTTASMKRAPLGLQMTFAIESQTDRIAYEMKMDPVNFRKMNFLHNGDESPLGECITGICHDEALEKTRSWRPGGSGEVSDSTQDTCSPWKSGVGFAVGAKWSIGGPFQASVRMNDDDTVEVWTGAVENGAGTLTGLAQITAEALGVSMDTVRMMPLFLGSDSSISGFEGGAAASRQTYNHGKAILIACDELKGKIARKAAKVLGTDPASVIVDGYTARSGSKSIKVASLFTKVRLIAATDISVMTDSEELVGSGLWIDDIGQIDERTGQSIGGKKLSPYYISVCQKAEVSVNVETGEIKVDRIVAANDAGRAINPELVHQQIKGSVATGVSGAIGEGLVFEDGRYVNTSLADYKLLNAIDMPKIESIILENGSDGPFGAKGVGEASTMPTAAAIRNAIHDAIGVWINKLPITPADIILASAGR